MVIQQAIYIIDDDKSSVELLTEYVRLMGSSANPIPKLSVSSTP